MGASHLNPITDTVVTAALFARELGGSGFVVITAPFPAGDKTELPNEFVAITLA